VCLFVCVCVCTILWPCMLLHRLRAFYIPAECGAVYNVDWWPAVSDMCCSAAVVSLRLCRCVRSSERRRRRRCRWVTSKLCVYIQGAREIGWKMVPKGTHGDRPDELPAIKTRRWSYSLCACMRVCVNDVTRRRHSDPTNKTYHFSKPPRPLPPYISTYTSLFLEYTHYECRYLICCVWENIFPIFSTILSFIHM